MAFVPRTFEEIRDDMIAYVRMMTDLTDFEVGSVTRTIIEAAAIEDDEQYYQMVQLLDAFKLSTATGQELDDRVAEFGITRQQPESATVEVHIVDDAMATGLLAFTISAGTTAITLDDVTLFPTSGYPINVRIGEGTANVEEVAASAINTTTKVLTVGATTKSHNIADRVSQVTGAANRTIATGVRVQVPATGTSAAVVFVTTESGTLINGNYFSTGIQARAEVPGNTGNVGAGKITAFTSAAPFTGAGVINRRNSSGGLELETDAKLRERAREQIQALAKATVLALRQGVIGVEDPSTGQRVATANLLESFVSNEVTLYVDDGTGFEPDQVDLAVQPLALSALAGATSLRVADTSTFPEEGTVLVSPESAVQMEIVSYTSINRGTTPHTINLATALAYAHDSGDDCVVVDLVESSSESGANFFQLANYPIVRSSPRVWMIDSALTNPILLVNETDYFLNRGTGHLEMIGAGMAEGAMIVATYSYYTGLLAEIQKVVDGDPDDSDTYPGLRAAGIRVVIETPVTRRVSVRVSISAEPGISELDLTDTVREAIEAYINSLGIGQDVIRAEIVARVMSVVGVADVIVVTPTSNIIVLENELPRPVNVDGDSLVTVN